MPNYSQCSCPSYPRPRPTGSTRAGAIATVLLLRTARALQPEPQRPRKITPPLPAPAERETATASTAGYSIRLLDPPGALCALCGADTGTGPVGHQHNQPICDLCLLEHCQPLGMVLALVSVTRAFAAVEPDDRQEVHSALLELGSFARIYDRVATETGTRRTFGVQLGDLLS